MNKNAQVTLKTLATHMGLSPSTVSKALNNDLKINPGTRERVSTLAMKMKYRPNLSARSLRTGRTKIIAVLVDNILACNSCSFITGLEAVATQSGYSIMVVINEMLNKATQSCSGLPFINEVDGVIIFSEMNRVDECIEYRIMPALPVLNIGNCSAGHEGIKILLNYERLAYEATLHLIKKGCSQIAFINGPAGKSYFGTYLSGYKKAMHEYSLPINEAVVFSSNLSESTGRHVADKLIDHGLPDGIVIADNLCAASFIKHISGRGYNCPQDLLVVSMGNEALAELISPGITTLNFDYEFIGKKTAEMFISSLDNFSKESFFFFPTSEIRLYKRSSSDMISKADQLN